MSDLVENPKDRFSRVAAHIRAVITTQSQGNYSRQITSTGQPHYNAIFGVHKKSDYVSDDARKSVFGVSIRSNTNNSAYTVTGGLEAWKFS